MTTLNSLPALPSVSRLRPQVRCACGCGFLTQRTFTPGHDARLKGLIIRVVRGLMTLDQVAEFGGPDTRKAVAKAMTDKALMRRWNIEIAEPSKEAKVG